MGVAFEGIRVSERRMSPQQAAQAREIAMRCEYCGKLCYGPRELVPEAVREHQRQCRPEEPTVVRLIYPRA